MGISCTLERRIIKYACPEVEDTLDLDDTEAKEVPKVTTVAPQAEKPTTARKMETTTKPIETSPRDVATTPKAVESSSTATTTTIDPEDIDASVEIVDTTDATMEDTTIDDINDSGEVPREKIEESGDIFTEEDLENENFRCQKNKSFKLDCNTCWCKADGKGPRYCTRIACRARVYKPLNQQQRIRL